ncbi:Proteophosphoglycan 5, related [Neospora caninum Liverpool]|uniref:Proteophosphoglycan 5, related n=1 Tax=Neospora caninum (strain Liverpool) TaxID=572307 RepID=F0VNH9_NEOCL|nr:Proteophosphoglycan 5, related [Neospora caninum Liverpool]CBZ55275.1 Proteophosphoglycan 5, related [Neospora caninum Liverpool]|eukprot:XP_003885303.1 Proteophosphoglycan 5, related [Neospora caninum Liverpool]
MEASLSTSITQGAVVAERLRREMESRDEKGVSFLVPEKESPSTGAATVKLSPLPETSALQKATTHCNIGTQVPSHKMSSLSSSSGGLFVVSENSQKNSDNLPSSANNSGNKLLSMAAQHTTTNSSPPPDTQEPDTGKKGTPDFSCSSAQKRVESNTGCCNSNETHDESRNDFQKIMPSPVSNVQGSVGKESTDDVSSMDKINENVNKSHDAAIRSEIKTTTSPAISHNCEVDASIILDPKRTSSPDTTEKSTNVETALKILKQGEACSSPRHELTLKAKHNPADSKSASLSIQAPNAVLTKQQTLPESSQTASLTPSFLSRRSSTMGAMPGDGSVELNPQKKAMSASKETDALVASLTSLSQSVTRNTSEGVLGGGADGRPNTAQSHNNITSNKNFFGNYPSFPLSGSHKSASTILTGLSTAYVTPGNGVDFGRMSQSAVVGASCAYASLANAMRKNEISGKNVPPAQMLSSQVPQSEEGYNNCNNTTAEYSSSFGKKAGISQERSWTAGVTEEYHRNSGEENYGNAQGIRTEDQALMLPLESIKSGGCNPANFINTADGVAGAISEHGAFQTHLGLSGATFQPGSTAAAAAAVLAQQESRPLLLTRFEMLEAYAKDISFAYLLSQVDLHEKHAFVQLSTLEAAFELVDKRRQLQDLHMGLVTAQQQSPSASAGASRSSPPARLAQGSTSQKLPHELQQQLSGVVSLPFDVPSPQSTTMAALFSAAAAAASCQASAEGGNTSALPAAVLQRLAPSKGASYNPSSSAQNSASLVSAAAQYVANTLLGPSGDPNDMTRVGIQSGHSITTKTGGCTFGSHAPSFSPSLQDSNPEGHASLNGEKAFLLQLLQHQQETSQQRSKTDVDRSQKSLQQPALLTETLMRAAAAAAGSKPSSHLQGGAEGVDGTGTTTGGSYARRQVQLQLQQLEELQKQQVGKGNQQRQQPQVSGTLEQHLFLQRKKPEPNTRMTQGVCTEIRSGQHLANSQGEDHGQLENMTFSQDGIPYPSCGLNLAADHVYNHSATLPSRSAALKVFQSYPSTDGPGSTGTILKNGGAKNGMQVIPFSNSNAEGNVMKDICTNGRKVPSNLFSQTLNTGSATLQHPASWARIPTSVAASSGSAPGTVLSMTREEDEERFASACREESSMGRANLLFELQQQRQHKSGGGCASLLPSLLSTESTTMCSQEAAMTATKTASNRMQIQTGAFHHHSLGVQPEYPEESDTSFPYSLTAVHRNGSMVGTKERDTDALYTSQQQHDLNAFLSISSNSKGLLTGTTKAVTSLGGATTTSTTPMTTSRSAQKTPFSTGMRFSVGADVSDTTFTGVVGSQESSAAMTSSGEATQQLLDVAATLMHKAVQETTDVEEIAQQLYQATRDLPQETVHELLLTLASRGGGHSSLGTSSGSSDTPKKPEEIGSTPLNPAATPFLVH